MKSIILSASLLIMLISCEESKPPIGDVDFRLEMRDFIIALSQWSKAQQSDFVIIPQNGQELMTASGEADGEVQTAYLDAIDATGRESMFYGYYADDQVTPTEDNQHLLALCLLSESLGIEVLATDYCSTQSKVDDSYTINFQNGFASFAADQRELNNIPNYPLMIHGENSNDIQDEGDIHNFLYLINSENYLSKSEFILDVAATNYDAIIMDLYFDEISFSQSEITQLKTKANGASRLVFCYMSIGEAEEYRFYWNSDWSSNEPDWLEPENPDWAGNYKVRYWDKSWQQIIYGNDASYLQLILNAGFDGVYLDIIDGFEYFEEL